ncbi:alpha-D-glucose phosphate-specific phosphoglucomutase [Desulfohalotomaculum tongense]|uniref:phosphoglucomutase/phosphomannomutase family protein n=1 Tax=Desulforadius tongensis TaxID=1216062 RepID=UPI00195DA916|nr:phosphoglucomutase/phosphomannomutase family protein [Desulforadius tongensis]MBM7853685.1 alpha-D-glucose phosphate-specific phosphoglucomutase [Desulforadius tongensis]
MPLQIAFGTDGWRGIIAEDFIFDNVRLVTRAVADYIIDSGMRERGVVIGYDNRFLSDRFAEEVAEEMNKKGVPVYLIKKPAPTPVTAYAIKIHNAAGAVMLTASHNPPEYNGYKFIPEYAGPALPHITKQIEENIKKQHGFRCQGVLEEAEGRYGRMVEREHWPEYCSRQETDPFDEYIKHISKLVDLEVIGRAKVKVVIDPMYGAGIGYLDTLLQKAGADVEAINNYRDPLFGGGMPEPTGHSLGGLRQKMKETGADIGLALDGDADRFGIIDSSGRYITPNQFLPLLYYHLMEVRGLRGPAARTVATTHLLDRIAEKYGQSVEETPVGFKYIGQCLHEKGAVMGGEESGGLSIKGHIPEKDGILAGLLAVEIMSYHGKSLTELTEQLNDQFGRVCSRRLDLRTTAAEKDRVLEQLKEFKPRTVAGQKVTGRVTVDGTKLLLADGSWTLIRPSGTEPLFRIYAEAESMDRVEEIQQEMKERLGL